MSEYELQAIDFLKRSGTEMTIKFTKVVDGFPFDPNDKLPHRAYKVVMKRGMKKFSCPFYDSYSNLVHGKNPNAYDVLAALERYEVDDTLAGFAEEFGYDLMPMSEYRRVYRIWSGCRDQHDRLMKFFGPEWMEELQQIN